MLPAIASNYRIVPTTGNKVVSDDGYIVIVTTGDSNMGTGANRPPLVTEPNIPTFANGIAFEFLSGSIVDLNTNSPRVGDISYANYESQWPSFIVEFYARTGYKIVFLPLHSGGAEFEENGDTNNWQPSPIGALRGPAETKWAALKALLGVDKPYIVFSGLGINSYNGNETIAKISAAETSYYDWVNLTFSTPDVRLINMGNVNKSVTDRILTGRGHVINAAQNYANIKETETLEDYWDWDFFGTRDAVGSVSPADGIHKVQAGNNYEGGRHAVYHIRPRFAKSFRESDAEVDNLSNTTATLNIQTTISSTIYWAVYPGSEAVHSKADIQNGVSAVTFGTLSGTSQQQIVNISGLTNNTWYRVHHWAVNAGLESDVFRTDRFYTRTTGSLHPSTVTKLARYSALTAQRTADITAGVEMLLNMDAFDYVDYCYIPRVATADRLVTLFGDFTPQLIGTPTFTDGVGWDFAPTGDNRINLNFTHADLLNFEPDNCFLAFSLFRNDDLGATTRFVFGANQSLFRSTRIGQTSGTINYCISEDGGGNNYNYQTNHIKIDTVYGVRKFQVRPNANAYDSQYTLNSELWEAGQKKQVTVCALELDETVAPFYYGCQNNRTTVNNVSGRFDGVPGPLLLGGGIDPNMKKLTTVMNYLK